MHFPSSQERQSPSGDGKNHNPINAAAVSRISNLIALINPFPSGI